MSTQHAAPSVTNSIVTTTATDRPRPSPTLVKRITIGCTMNASSIASAIGTTTARARYSAATATTSTATTPNRFIPQEQSNRYATRLPGTLPRPLEPLPDSKERSDEGAGNDQPATPRREPSAREGGGGGGGGGGVGGRVTRSPPRDRLHDQLKDWELLTPVRWATGRGQRPPTPPPPPPPRPPRNPPPHPREVFCGKFHRPPGV